MAKLLLTTILLGQACLAQTPVTLVTSNAQQPSISTVTQVGVQGTTQYCYWVVAVYTGGKSNPVGPLCTHFSNATLSTSNYNVVAFNTPSSPYVSVSSYDLLRTTTQTPPTGSCACAVLTAQSSSPLNDQSNTLSAYTVATLATVAVSAVGDNVSLASTVQGTLAVNGTKVLNLPTVAGANFPNGLAATGTTAGLLTLTTMPSAVAVNATTDANNTIYVSPIFVPTTFTSTGGCWYNGATVTTDKHMIEIFNAAGTLLANSATAGVADSGNANKYQCTTWTATVVLAGPATYWVGAVSNGTTDTLNTYAAGSVPTGFFAASSSQTFGTPANITPPSSFNANQGALMQIY